MQEATAAIGRLLYWNAFFVSYGLPVCDLYYNSGSNKLMMSLLTIDGLHPNNVCQAEMGDYLIGPASAILGYEVYAKLNDNIIRLFLIIASIDSIKLGGIILRILIQSELFHNLFEEKLDNVVVLAVSYADRRYIIMII